MVAELLSLGRVLCAPCRRVFHDSRGSRTPTSCPEPTTNMHGVRLPSRHDNKEMVMKDDLPVRDPEPEPDTTETNPEPTQDEEVNQNITDDES